MKLKENIYFIEDMSHNDKDQYDLTLEEIEYSSIKNFSLNAPFKENASKLSEIKEKSKFLTTKIERTARNKRLKNLDEGRILANFIPSGFRLEDNAFKIEQSEYYLLDCSSPDFWYLTHFFNLKYHLDLESCSNPPVSALIGKMPTGNKKKIYHFSPLSVGQGNCSFICPTWTMAECYFIDFGGNDYGQCANFIDFVFEAFDKIVILITHWDMDHYCFLNYLTPIQLQKISIISPYQPRITLHAIATVSYCYSHGVYIHLSPGINFFNWQCFDIYRFNYDPYRMNRARLSKNNSGLIYNFFNNQTILFPGDSHYDYINIPNDIDYLYVTHHGSRYFGNNIFHTVATTANIALLSYGQNSYGHPTHESIDEHTHAGWTLLHPGQFKDYLV